MAVLADNINLLCVQHANHLALRAVQHPPLQATPASHEHVFLPDAVECARAGLAVKPRKGSALLFWSLKPNSKDKDLTSLHGGCPVLKGDKWSATK